MHMEVFSALTCIVQLAFSATSIYTNNTGYKTRFPAEALLVGMTFLHVSVWQLVPPSAFSFSPLSTLNCLELLCCPRFNLEVREPSDYLITLMMITSPDYCKLVLEIEHSHLVKFKKFLKPVCLCWSFTGPARFDTGTRPDKCPRSQ